MSKKEAIQQVQLLIDEANLKEGDYLKISNILMDLYKKHDDGYDSEEIVDPERERNIRSVRIFRNLYQNLISKSSFKRTFDNYEDEKYYESFKKYTPSNLHDYAKTYAVNKYPAVLMGLSDSKDIDWSVVESCPDIKWHYTTLIANPRIEWSDVKDNAELFVKKISEELGIDLNSIMDGPSVRRR